MKAITDLYEEFVSLYGYYLEVREAVRKWRDFLTTNMKYRDKRLFFGPGDPNRPNATYQYVRTFAWLIDASDDNGINVSIHRRSVIAFSYALWEDQYRGRIAHECKLANKNKIKSDVFYDLNKYRQAILHSGGRLAAEPKVIRFFNRGEEVLLTDDHMYELFSLLVGELNRLGREYYRQDPQFSLDRPLNG